MSQPIAGLQLFKLTISVILFLCGLLKGPALEEEHRPATMARILVLDCRWQVAAKLPSLHFADRPVLN